jgi:hypothetical protein
MREMAKFSLESGGSIWVEVETVPGAPSRGVVENAITAAVPTFEAALENIRPIANTIIAKLKNLTSNPDQIQVEFGLKLTAQAGAILASASGEANFKVALTWKREG